MKQNSELTGKHLLCVMCGRVFFSFNLYLRLFKTTSFCRFYSVTMISETVTTNNVEEHTIKEGLATIKSTGKVFYNPVQEFNRDLSISVLTAFINNCKTGKQCKNNNEEINTIENQGAFAQAGVKYDNGVTILEALSATGLRSIRYAKEVPGIREIIANDISAKAVESIKKNVVENDVSNLVTASHSDATMLMYQHRLKENQFDAIDLDPYGCPSIFLDAAVQAVKEGGLLLVTATDMAVLAGNSPETCYSKYGSISLNTKSCHEMALRILLQCIESHANRYGRYIQPLLSISADFYIRIFVRVFTGAHKCKYTLSKLSMVHHCKGCESFVLQPLGSIKKNEKNNQDRFVLPTGASVNSKCEHCGHSLQLGGPIWSAPIHSLDFVQQIIQANSESFTTHRRIEGILHMVLEELVDSPLYYTLEKLSSTLHVATPPMITIRSAILNAGYQVSYSHVNRTSIKTNAPSRVVWDIMRCWENLHPASQKRLAEGDAAANILNIKPETEYSFEAHPLANPLSKQRGYVRFQENPLPYWGPGTRATAMVGKEKMTKSKRNQGKRKRKQSDDNTEESL